MVGVAVAAEAVDAVELAALLVTLALMELTDAERLPIWLMTEALKPEAAVDAEETAPEY